MCVIVTKPAGTEISVTTLKSCWDANSHGAGLAYALDGELHIRKGFMTWESFRDFYGEYNFWKAVPVMFHFRIRTHGDKDEVNTHPFEVIPKKLAFAHNGVMPDMEVPTRPDLSDTQVFNRYILQQLPQNFLKNQGIMRLIDESLGRNKLAFLDNLGNITHFNAALGYEEDGVWYSNKNHVRTSHSIWSGSSKRSGVAYGYGGHNGGYHGSWGLGSNYESRFGGGSQQPLGRMWPADDMELETEDLTKSTEISVDGKEEDLDAMFDPDVEDWYCEDCCMWFEAEDDTGNLPHCVNCGSDEYVGWLYSAEAVLAWGDYIENSESKAG